MQSHPKTKHIIQIGPKRKLDRVTKLRKELHITFQTLFTFQFNV